LKGKIGGYSILILKKCYHPSTTIINHSATLVLRVQSNSLRPNSPSWRLSGQKSWSLQRKSSMKKLIVYAWMKEMISICCVCLLRPGQ